MASPRQDLARDGVALDLAGPRQDAHHPQLPEGQLHRMVLRHAHIAVDLHRAISDGETALADEELAGRGLPLERIAGIGAHGRVQHHAFAGEELGLHVRQHVLNRLEARDRSAELLPLAGIGDGHPMHLARDADHRRRVQQPVQVDARHAQPQAGAKAADHVGDRDADLVEMDVGVDVLARHGHVARIDAHARCVELDEDRGDALGTRFGIRHAHHDGDVREGAAGDEVLLAGDDQLLAVALRAGADAGGVGARMRLGHREAHALVAVHHRRQERAR
ncbi:hypothetical protein Ddc_19062 [Ditylenchus destructor]|nr:hypothetical protein Ddc_19062 [Ditylenchus destructor]